MLKSENVNIQTADIDRVDVFLVKHGHFYHPAKIAVVVSDETFLFVLNLAASEEGLFCMEREYPVLKMLGDENPSIPSVYEKATVTVGDNSVFSMFLATWFDGYNEFHISYDDGVKKIIVWDYEKGVYFLSEDEVFQLYKKASEIMTDCYNVETFEQIQPWHHAAGDFVVKNNGGSIDVKLITVRQYTSLFENTFDDTESILEAALIFLVSLSIRMRLDRVDGVDESVWADDVALEAVVEGFCESLGHHKRPAVFEADLLPSFKKYVSDTGLELLNEFSRMVLGSYHPDSSDFSVASDNLSRHVAGLEQELRKAVDC